MNSLYWRLWYMLIGWGSVGLIYSLTSSQDQISATMLTPSALDNWFEFDPSAIWIYLSFFVLVPLAYFLCPQQRLIWLARAMQLSALGAGLIFMLWPTTMQFPEVTQNTFSASALKILIRYDSLQNCLPSLHVTLTILAVWAVWQKPHPVRNWIIALWALAITISILQLHRHQFVDALGGVILALCAGLLSQLTFSIKANSRLRKTL